MHKTVSVVQKTFNILAAELCDWSQWSGHRAIIGGHLTISFVCFWSWYLGTVAREDKKLTWNYVQRDKWSPAWVGWARARQARDPAHCHCTCPVSTLFGHANYEKGDQKCIILQSSDFLLWFILITIYICSPFQTDHPSLWLGNTLLFPNVVFKTINRWLDKVKTFQEQWTILKQTWLLVR